MTTSPLTLNWHAGWWLVLAAFAVGAVLGLFFHRDDFLGGYASFRRRMLRLGHIALAALGMLNLIYALGPASNPWAASLLVAGGITMPVVCFLSAWRKNFRHLFFVPVLALLAAVMLALIGPKATRGGDLIQFLSFRAREESQASVRAVSVPRHESDDRDSSQARNDN